MVSVKGEIELSDSLRIMVHRAADRADLPRPRSILGAMIRGCLDFLPEPLRLELLDRLTAAVIMETRLGITVLRQPTSPFRLGNDLIEDYGIVGHRLVTSAGVNAVATYLAGGAAANTFRFHGLGTGAGAAAIGDVALTTEITTEYAVNNTRPTGTQTNPSANVYQTVATNTVDAAVANTEWGLFSQAATGGGTLFDRFLYSVINLANGDGITTTFALTLTAGS